MGERDVRKTRVGLEFTQNPQVKGVEIRCAVHRLRCGILC
jgi:hypothetical protein